MVKSENRELTYQQISRVTDDLEARGGKCIVSVFATAKDGEVKFFLDHIAVTFPTGRKWDIVEIQEEKVIL